MRKTNNKNKNRKPNSRPVSNNKYRETDRGGKPIKEDTTTSSNDPAWYAADPVILKDAASFPFSWPTGATTTHNLTLYNSEGQNQAPYSRVPGLVTLKTAPTIGFALRATDPINVAAQAIYSFVRHANSGHSNYDSPDLMLYILGMANNFSFLVWCQRLYGLALTYDQRNRYISDSLIKANGVDPNSIKNNLANFRFWINTLIAKMASFAVPATLSVFSRMSFMYADYYIEGTSVKDQLYQYAPVGFHKFGLDSNSRGKLFFTPLPTDELMTVDDIMSYGNELFGAIWEQEDFGIMSGDILKAYGDRIIKLASIPEAYQIFPKFDAMVLTQMKNSLILDADPADVGQSDAGLLISVLAPSSYSTATYFGTDTVVIGDIPTLVGSSRMALLKDIKAITVDTDDPTPEVVMEASRLLYGYDAYLGELRTGTEFVRQVEVEYDIDDKFIINQINIESFNNADSVANKGKLLQTLKHFHYIPRIYFWNNFASGKSQVEEYFDLDNFAILDNEDIAKLHTAAVINMYAVPSIGKVQ